MAELDLAATLQRPAVVAPVVLIVAYFIYQLFFKPSNLPDLPVLNARQGEWFPILRASWRNALDFKAACKQVHNQYYNQACIVPVIGAGTMVVIPSKQIRSLHQPDNVLSMHDAVIDDLQTDYTIEKRAVRDPVHHHLVTTTLTQQVGNLIPALVEETALSLDAAWGTDTAQWRDVCVFKTLQESIGRVTNRIFVGAPACRDPELVRLGVKYAEDVPLGSALLRMFPEALRPLVAPIITIPNRLHESKFMKILLPTVKQRLHEYDERRGGEGDPEKQKLNDQLEPEPNDLLQWMIKQAKESGDPYLCKPRTLALRVLILNFASIHTSSFAITGAVLDLVSANTGKYIEELRDEIRTVLAEHGGEWNKRALARMEKLDSAFRESQRLNSLNVVGTARLVVAKEGFTTSDGLHLPQGCKIYTPGYAVHHDSDVYPDAETFRPFRFSEQRRAAEGKGDVDNNEDGGGGGDKASYVSRARLQWATTTNDFLAFGHGRNACPGRFFAAAELKLMLAYLILNYDFQMLDRRPENKWLTITLLPPMEQIIRIRRRQPE